MKRLVILQVKDSRRIYNTILCWGRVGQDGKTRISNEAFNRLMAPVPRGICVRIYG